MAIAYDWVGEDGIQPSGRARHNAGLWHPPDSMSIENEADASLIRYGRDLIQHTAVYLGPSGKIASLSNGMNCQNCHLRAGTKPYAANYSAVAAMYPRYRKRSGTVEGFAKRINDCFERSLNGKALDPGSREMKAMIAYLKWVGKDVPPGQSPEGSGLLDIPYLLRPADPGMGKEVYNQWCTRCHGQEGEGLKEPDAAEWTYPPLWGPNSYNTGAGLYRISKFAAFVRSNMPYGIDHDAPLLTDEEAWDVAAYVNSMPRPHKEFPDDWPKLADKPIDHPFGPYADTCSERTHKYGPFQVLLSHNE